MKSHFTNLSLTAWYAPSESVEQVVKKKNFYYSLQTTVYRVPRHDNPTYLSPKAGSNKEHCENIMGREGVEKINSKKYWNIFQYKEIIKWHIGLLTRTT